MQEILNHLPAGARVLDVGSGAGSFSELGYPFLVVRVDLNRPARGTRCFVQADAARLPFPNRTFDAVVLNNSLEHFIEMKQALQELGRVVKPEGAAFVSVPDARSFSDRLYRKVYRRGGGHVNIFVSAAQVQEMLTWYLQLPYVATRPLFTSFTYLRREADRGQRRMRFRGFSDGLLAAATLATRVLDSYLGLRTGVYGWALYLGSVREPVDERPWRNVCVRCGQAHVAAWLEAAGRVRKAWPLRYYHCPGCSAFNFFFADA